MELKELKCKNCGASLKVDPNAKTVTCNFCNTSFSVETAEDTGYQFEKGRMRAQDERYAEVREAAAGGIKIFGTVVAVQAIIAGIIGLIIVGTFIFFTFTAIVGTKVQTDKTINNVTEKDEDNKIIEEVTAEQEKMKEEIKKKEEEAKKQAQEAAKKKEIDNFNHKYEIYKGTQAKGTVEWILDEAGTNNKKSNEHLVTVVFKNIKTTKEADMIKIKDSLKNFKNNKIAYYEVVLDYNTEGYVNKVTITEK